MTSTLWALNLFCYGSHFISIHLHLSLCLAHSLVLCTDAIEREICRLIVSILRVLASHNADLPFRYAFPHPLLIVIPLWSTALSSEESTSGASPNPLWSFSSICFHKTALAWFLSKVFLFVFVFTFCLFHGLLFSPLVPGM